MCVCVFVCVCVGDIRSCFVNGYFWSQEANTCISYIAIEEIGQ